jgi:hypothetical protein
MPLPEGALARTQRRRDRLQSVGPVAGLSQYLWKLERPARGGEQLLHGIPMGQHEAPWNISRFYGSSISARQLPRDGSDRTELVTAELDLDMIEEVRRVWQFYRSPSRNLLADAELLP